MRFLAVLPILTALLAVVCVLRPASGRAVRLAVAVAVGNIMVTPLSSGEWFYQRAEDAAYDRAVAEGDFAAFDRLLAQHDPQLQPRMIALAVVLLVSLVGLAVLQHRRRSGAPIAPVLSHIASGCVLLAAAATLVQGVLLLVG